MKNENESYSNKINYKMMLVTCFHPKAWLFRDGKERILTNGKDHLLITAGSADSAIYSTKSPVILLEAALVIPER